MCIELHIAPFSYPGMLFVTSVISIAYMDSTHWLPGCNSLSARALGANILRAILGCHLTTLFGTDAVATTAVIQAPAVPAVKTAAPKKRGWLPVLTVLFLISYGLMTMLIVEQGQTIESQRALIRELFRDSTELSAIK